jgi:hypothetical protein
VNTVMNLRIPQNAGKLLSSCTTSGFSGRAPPFHEISYQIKQVDSEVSGPSNSQNVVNICNRLYRAWTSTSSSTWSLAPIPMVCRGGSFKRSRHCSRNVCSHALLFFMGLFLNASSPPLSTAISSPSLNLPYLDLPYGIHKR